MTNMDTSRRVAEALNDFLAENGFTAESYDAATVAIPIGPVTIPLPNTEGRKKVVRLHDLHHVATGYQTDLVGEAEIGAWELRAGCTTLAAWVYNGMAVALGLVLGPRRVWRAFRGARGMRTLYRLGLPYDEALAKPLAELRRRLGIPATGLAR